MHKSEIVKHAQEVITTEIEAARAISSELITECEGWSLSQDVEGLLREGMHGFHSYETEPRPGLVLLNAAFYELAVPRRSTKQISRFIGQQLMPILQVPSQMPRHSVELGTDTNYGSCGMAESYFKDALEQLRTKGMQNHRRLGIYHDAAGGPLLLRKSADESTALTLAPLALKNMVLPSGSIVAVDSRANDCPTGTSKQLSFTIDSYLADHETCVTPLRLSAWAYAEAIDRQLFAVEGYPFSRSAERDIWWSSRRAQMLGRTSLEDFVQAAEDAIDLCTA